MRIGTVMDKKRGRPRKFDYEACLDEALGVFWQKGLSATSLDDLAVAMSLNRPSIYNSFGNKEQIYRKAMDRFMSRLNEALSATLEQPGSVSDSLNQFFAEALNVYCAGSPALGCFILCTAPVESVRHTDVRQDLNAVITLIDESLTQRLEAAIVDGELAADTNPGMTAGLLQAVLHTVAIRARAGEPRSSLQQLASFAVDQCCPPTRTSITRKMKAKK